MNDVPSISKAEYDEIRLNTDIAHALLTRKVTEFLKELEPFVELLEQTRDGIDRNYIRAKKFTVAGSTVSAVGGGLVVAGTAAVPVTFGGSLALTVVGGSLVIGGTATSLYAHFKGAKDRKEYFKICQERAKEIEKEGEKLSDLYEEYIQCCTCLAKAVQLRKITDQFFELDLDTLKHIMMGLYASKNINGKAITTSTIIKAVTIGPGVVKTGNILGSSTCHILCRAVKAAGPSIAIGSKIAMSFGVGLGSIGILADIVIGVMALYDILSKNKCSESRTLTRNIAKARRLVSDIQDYLELLVKEPKELLKLANNAIGYDEENEKLQLLQENLHLKAALQDMEQKHEAAKTELEQQIKNLQAELKEMQQQMQHQMQEQIHQLMQQQMQQLMHQLMRQQQTQLISQQETQRATQ